MTVGRIWTRCFWPFFWLLLSPWWLTGDISTTVGTFQPPCRLKKTNKPEDLASYTRAAQQVGKAKHWNIRNLDHFWEVEGCKGGVLNPPTQRKFMKKTTTCWQRRSLPLVFCKCLYPGIALLHHLQVVAVRVDGVFYTSLINSCRRASQWIMATQLLMQLENGACGVPAAKNQGSLDEALWMPHFSTCCVWEGPEIIGFLDIMNSFQSFRFTFFSGFPCWNFQGCPHDITCVQSQFGVDRSGGYGASLWSGSQCLWDSWKVAEGLTTHGPRTPTQSGGQSGADLDESCITHFLLLVDLMHTTRLS